MMAVNREQVGTPLARERMDVDPPSTLAKAKAEIPAGCSSPFQNAARRQTYAGLTAALVARFENPAKLFLKFASLATQFNLY
jgi:hypothetical protein